MRNSRHSSVILKSMKLYGTSSYSQAAAGQWRAGKGRRRARQEPQDFSRIADISGNNQSHRRRLLSFPSTSHHTISLDRNETLLGHACLHADNDHRTNILTMKIYLQLRTAQNIWISSPSVNSASPRIDSLFHNGLFCLITAFTHQKNRNMQFLG